MKKIFSILIILVAALNSFSQTTIRANQITADDKFFPPVKDTTQTPGRVGQLTIRAADTSLYMAISITAPRKWMKIAKLTDLPSGGSSGGNDTSYTFKNSFHNIGVVVFADDFKRDYIGSDYTTAFPATTATISSDGLRLVGAPGDYANYISRNYYSCAEKFSQKITYVNNTISPFTYGIGVGMQSQNAFCCQYSVLGALAQYTGNPNIGKTGISGNIGYSYTHYGSSVISSISVGDTIQVELIRDNLTYIVNSTNITTGETSTDTVITPLGVTTTNFYVTNTSKPTLNFFGGDITVIGYELTLLSPFNPDYLFVGNSITVGEAATAYNKTFPNRTFESDSGIVVETNAGGGDYTQSVINRLPEFYKKNPWYMPLMIGGNDILFGVSTATWQQNLRIIRDSLTAHGIQVIHLYPTPRNGTDMTALVNFLDTCINFSSDIKIRSTWDSLRTGTALKAVYDIGDGTHLNDSGHHYVALKIREALTPRARTPIPTIPPSSIVADGFYDPGDGFLSKTGKWKSIPQSIIISGGGGGGGGGDVYKYGTPTATSLAVWRNDSTIEATPLTYASNELLHTGSLLSRFRAKNVNASGDALFTAENSSGEIISLDMLGSAPGGGLNNTGFITGTGANGIAIFQYGNTGPIRFLTTTSVIERMRLTNDGKLGLGTASPDSFLHVVGGIKFVTGRQGAGKVLTSDANGGADWQTPTVSNPALSKSATFEFPSGTENIGFGWRTAVDITISSVDAVLVGSGSPSVTFQIVFGSDRSSGTNVFSSGRTATSVTTGHTFSSSFNDATIPAGSWVWLTTSAQSGTVTQIELTINYTED